MSQITTGLRAVLSSPYIYNMFQLLLGARQGRMRFVSDFVRPKPAATVLDIGCGTAEILDYLPGVNYWGFDISHEYIDHAHEKFGERGNFRSKELNVVDLVELPEFDIVLVLGLLHHLDERAAQQTLALACQALKPGGRVITIDPCIESGQNPIARFLGNA